MASLPFRLLLLGLGSLAIKLLTTLYYLARNPAAAMKAVPANLREQCLEIDLTCAPELVPGMERAYDQDARCAFLFRDILRRYDQAPDRTDYWDGNWKRPTARTLTVSPFLLLFFVIAAVYRLYVKAAAVWYLPLLLIDPPNRRHLWRRTAAGAKLAGNKSEIAIQASVLGLALFGLLGLNGLPELQEAVAGWLDDNVLAVWQAVSASEWIPKSVLSLLVLQSGAALVGFHAEAKARRSREQDTGAAPGPVARRWIGIAFFCQWIRLIFILALVVGVFAAIAPNAILVAERIWKFFV